MAKLPVITSPKHKLTIPSTGKIVEYRPFKMKEEKLLLMAMESGVLEDIVSATKQIIQNCSFGEVDPEKLSTFDIEYFFLQLRIRSKGERQVLEFPCNRVLLNDDGTPRLDEDGDEIRCDKKVNLVLDLRTATVDTPVKGANRVMVTDDIGIVFKYPGFDMFSKNNFSQILEGEVEQSATEMLMSLIVNNIDCVFQGDNVTDASECTEEELIAFIEDMPDTAFEKIKNFFVNIPKIKIHVKYKCPCMKHEHAEDIEGLQNFLR